VQLVQLLGQSGGFLALLVARMEVQCLVELVFVASYAGVHHEVGLRVQNRVGHDLVRTGLNDRAGNQE